MRQWPHEGEAFHHRGRHRHPHSQGAIVTWQESRFLLCGWVEARRCVCLRKWVGVPISKIKNKKILEKSAFGSFVSTSLKAL